MTERILLQQSATICCCNTDNCNETPYVAGVRPYDEKTDAGNGATNANSNAAGHNAPAQSGDQKQSTVKPKNGSSRPHTFTVTVLTGMWLLSR